MHFSPHMYAFVSYSLPGSFILPSGSGTLQVRQRKRWSPKMRSTRTWKVDIIPTMWTQLGRLCSGQRQERNSSARSSRRRHRISVLWGKYYFTLDHCTNLLRCLTCSPIPRIKRFSAFFFQVKLWHSRLWGLLSDCQISGLYEAVCTELWYLFITGKRI